MRTHETDKHSQCSRCVTLPPICSLRLPMNEALEAAVCVSGGVAAVFSYSFVSAWFRRGAPFVPTAQRKIEKLFAAHGGLLSHIPLEKRRSMRTRLARILHFSAVAPR